MTTCEHISLIIEEREILIEDKSNVSERDILLDELSSNTKKKKKKTKDADKIENEEIQTIQISIEEKEIADMFDLKHKKRKKDKKDKDKDIIQNKYYEDYDPPNYNYETLLHKLYSHFQDDNINVIKTKNTLKLPLVHRFGSKKTGWINFKECCTSIDREQTTIINYLISELSTEANLDGNGILLIKGIYNQKNIENILRKFIINFVQCSVCKSLETKNRKDSAKRLTFLECLSCKSTRVLPQIITGHKSVSKNEKISD
jgi:translation initiation factor 2 subunit 2